MQIQYIELLMEVVQDYEGHPLMASIEDSELLYLGTYCFFGRRQKACILQWSSRRHSNPQQFFQMLNFS